MNPALYWSGEIQPGTITDDNEPNLFGAPKAPGPPLRKARTDFDAVPLEKALDGLRGL